jgi:hypothetical protein
MIGAIYLGHECVPACQWHRIDMLSPGGSPLESGYIVSLYYYILSFFWHFVLLSL